MSIRLYFVEGLPGVGKSTFAYSLHKQLLVTNDNVVYYKEETCQPVDLFRQAIIPQQKFEKLLTEVTPPNSKIFEGQFVFTLQKCNSGIYESVVQ